MRIVCPACASEYDVESGRIGPDGQNVRCVNCRETWFVLPPLRSDLGRTASRDFDTVRHGESFSVDRAANPGRRRALRPPPPPSAPGRAWGAGHALVAATLLLIIAGAAALAMRVEAVRRVPASARLFAALGLPVNLVGVTLADVTSSVGAEGTGRVLVVEGRIVNPTARPVAVPRLDLTVAGAAGEELYRWSAKPALAELAAGASVPFRLRLASPPPEGQVVVVTFERPAPGSATVASR